MASRAATFRFSRISALHILALFTLAVAQPLYDVLGRAEHAPFFIAHQSRALDICLLVLIVSFLLPAVLCLVLWLLNKPAPKLARGLFVLLLLFLFAAIFLPIPGKWNADTAGGTILFAFVAATIAVFLYLFTDRVRTFVTFLSIAIPLSPLLFVTTSSMRSFLSTPQASNHGILPSAGKLPNILMIIFDELPLNSLLDEQREIDEVRYPNFHRLSKTATWFRNTTTIHHDTSGAVVSLLVGGEYQQYSRTVHGNGGPGTGLLDRARFPGNLFSLLENDYRVVAVELMTKLAGETAQAGEYVPPLETRLVELVVDASILYGHVVTPVRFRRILPAVEGQWRSFLDARSEPSHGSPWPYVDSYGRLAGVKQMMDSIRKTNVPTLYFLHSLLPHFPFVFNERGQIHANKLTFLTMHFREATGVNLWPDESAATLAYQAHLLQLSFTDVLLGRILDRLGELDLFEHALIIVTSDHGTNFYWDSANLPRETLIEIQARGTLYVPWIIKLPGQTRGEISDKPVQTIDIVPTIADILGKKIPWEAEGVSALAGTRPERKPYAYLPGYREFGSGIDENYRSLRRKIELFGTHCIEGIYRSGPHEEMVGKPVSSFPSIASTLTLELSRPDQYQGMEPTGPRVPAYVEGQIKDLSGDLKQSELTVAVAINGIIRNTTRSTRRSISNLTAQDRIPPQAPEGRNGTKTRPDEPVHFLVRVPPESFVKGRNKVTLHAIVEDEQGRPASLMDIPEK